MSTRDFFFKHSDLMVKGIAPEKYMRKPYLYDCKFSKKQGFELCFF